MLTLYATPEHDYFYCLWMDLDRPSGVNAKLGEGKSPTEAVWDLSDVSWRSVSFDCLPLLCDELRKYFGIDEADLVYSTDDEEREAEEAFFHRLT